MLDDPLPSNPTARVISNPGAGAARHHAGLRTAIGALAELGWTLSWRDTRRPGHAAELAAEAARDGIDIVVAAGGDGTINEVVNGLVGTDVVLTVMPVGTANVLAAELGLIELPSPLHRADLETAASHLASGVVHRVDTGFAEPFGVPGRHFLLMAGVGLDAAITREVEGPGKELKKAVGPMAFGAVGLKALFETAGTPAQVQVGSQRFDGPLLMGLVSNTRLYGGAISVSPEAMIDDGQVDIDLFFGENVLSSMAHIGSVITSRPEPITPGPEHAVEMGPPEARRVRTRAAWMRVVTEKPLPAHLDGEPYGETPVVFSVRPLSLRLLVPPTANPALFGPHAGQPSQSAI
jgi:YegS/Rv2252/BmrU family lipid kinase